MQKRWAVLQRDGLSRENYREAVSSKVTNGELTICCRNRHCGKCQSLTRAEWLEDHRSNSVPGWRKAAIFSALEAYRERPTFLRYFAPTRKRKWGWSVPNYPSPNRTTFSDMSHATRTGWPLVITEVFAAGTLRPAIRDNAIIRSPIWDTS
jgi:hypothetical protein